MNNYQWNQHTPAPYGHSGQNPYDANGYANAAPAAHDPYASSYATQVQPAPSYGYGQPTAYGAGYGQNAGYGQAAPQHNPYAAAGYGQSAGYGQAAPQHNPYAAPPAYDPATQAWAGQQAPNAWTQPQAPAASVVQFQHVPYAPTTQVNKIIGAGPDVSLAELQAGRLPFNRIVGTRVKHDYLGRNICSRLNEGGKLSEQEFALTAKDRLVFTSVDKRKLNPQTQVFSGAPHEQHGVANHFRQKLYMCRLSTGRVYAIFEPDPKSSDAYNKLRSFAEDLAARGGYEHVGREWGTTGYDQSQFTFDMPPQY